MAQGNIDEYIHTLNADSVAKNYVDVVAVHGSSGWASIWTWAQEAPAKKVWMTETSGQANTWDGAMSLAQQIRDALYNGNASAWTFWSFNVSTGSEPYGLMVNNTPTSRYYTSKQFYKWARPGAYRVATTSSLGTILPVAFQHQANGTVTIVLINTSTGNSRVVSITGAGLPSRFATYMSSDYRNCVRGPDVTNGRFVIPPSSVATLYAGPLHNSFFDFADFAVQWGRPDCNVGNNWCDGADQNQDDNVLYEDLATIADNWLLDF